ncbi:HAD family hydrolase [Streptomyces sp. NPDC054770]
MIKLVATDVDETLILADGHLPRENVRALQDAYTRGVVIALTTARTVSGAGEIQSALGIPVAVVAECGSTVVDAGNETLRRSYFDRQSVVGVIEMLTSASVDYICTAEGVNFKSSDRVTVKSGLSRSMSEGIPDLAFVSRIVVRGGADSQLLKDLAASEFVEIFTGSADLGEANDAILVPRGVSKWSGLAFLCAALGIRATEVLAVGDSESDIEMIKRAGVGVAVRGGLPELLEQADWVAPSAAEGGLAKAVQKFVLRDVPLS